MKNKIFLDVIDQKADLIGNLSDAVWDAAETAFTEYKSADVLCNALQQEGFEVQRGLAGIDTAFSARFGQGKPVVGILAEFDALSGLSQVSGCCTKTPLTPGGNGHGCGHHLLGAGSFGAAVAVKEYLQQTKQPGTVIYFGCPGEEGGSGKAFMAGAHVFDECDFCITWHPGDTNAVNGYSSLANYQVLYKFDGVSAHAAAAPHLGRGALDAVTLMNVGIQFLREHVVPEARMHYAVTDTGGFSPNVVQPHAEVLYLLRAPETPQVQEIFERVNDIAQGAALMTGTKMSYDFIKACSNIVPNNVLGHQLYQSLCNITPPTLTEQEREYIQSMHDTVEQGTSPLEMYSKLLKDEEKKQLEAHSADIYYDFVVPYVPVDEVMPGSSDVGDVSWVCPTAQITTATWFAGTPGHSWQTVSQGKGSVAKKATVYAAKVMADTCIKIMQDPDRIKEAKEELKTRLKGGSYRCPIPEGVKPRAIDPNKK